MDNLLNTLSSVANSVISPVETWVKSQFPGMSPDQHQTLTDYAQNPNPSAIQSLGNQFQNWIGSEAAQAPQQLARANQYLNNIPDTFGNLQQHLIQGAGDLANNIFNAPQRLLAQTPQYLQQGAQAIDNAIPGQGFLQNAGRDIVNAGAGALSLPGIGAGMVQNPQTALPTIGNMASGIAQEYASLLADPQGHFMQHPVNTILDVLPGVGLLGKLGKVGEAGLAGDAGEAGEAGTAALTPQAQLEHLMSYPQALADRGYSTDMIDQIGAPKAHELMANQVSPQEFSANPEAFLNNDVASLNRAEASTETNAQGGLQQYLSPLKAMPEDIQKSFADWVNSRSAAPIEGMAKQQEFSQYDNQGLQGILNFQKNPAQYPALKTYFDNKFQDLQQAGIDLGYRQNYLPQLWKNEHDAEQFYNKTLNPNSAPFTFEALLSSYEEGLAHGLEPKYNSLGELAQWYEQKSNKLMADNQYFDHLRDNSLITPTNQAPAGWTQLGQGFPQKTVTMPDGSTYSGTYSAPSTLAGAINNYLSTDDTPLSKLANVQSNIKNTILSSGIPGTGINFHGLNSLVRQTLSSDNPVAGFWTGAKYLANPRLAQAAIDNDLQGAARAVHAGLNLSIEDNNFFDKNAPTSLLGQASNKFHAMFSDPLFKQAIPALKLQRFGDIANQLVQSGMDQDSAERTAAVQTNNIFGGQNLQQIARDKNFQDLMRNLVFAPDWQESNIGVGKGIVKGLLDPTNPEGKVYRTMARNMVMGYIGMNLTNKITSGHFAFQNAAGHEFDLDTGQDTGDGKKVYIQPFGTAIDYVKIPSDVASSLAGGNTNTLFSTVRNRIAPVLGSTMDQATNTNYLGQPLAKPGANLGQQIVGRGTDALTGVVPPQLGAAARFATGNQTAGEALASGLQAPIRFGSGANTQAEQNLVDTMRSGGATGEEIANSLQAYKTNASAKYGGNPYTPQTTQHGFNVMDMFGNLGQPKQQQTASTHSTGDPLLDALNKQKTTDQQTTEIKNIFSSGMTPQEIQNALQSKGISYQEAQITMLKSLTDTNRSPVLKHMLGQMGGLWTEGVGTFAKEGLISTTMTAQWVADGTITSQQRTAIDKVISQAKGTSTTGYSSGYGSGFGSGSKYGITRPTLGTVAMPQVPAIVTPKITQLQQPNNNFYKVTSGEIQKIQKLGTFNRTPNSPTGKSGLGSNYAGSLKYVNEMDKIANPRTLQDPNNTNTGRYPTNTKLQ